MSLFDEQPLTLSIPEELIDRVASISWLYTWIQGKDLKEISTQTRLPKAFLNELQAGKITGCLESEAWIDKLSNYSHLSEEKAH